MVTHSKFDFAMSSSLLDSNMRLPHRYKTFASKTQYQMVLATLHKHQECGFYWGAITGKEANGMLAAERSDGRRNDLITLKRITDRQPTR